MASVKRGKKRASAVLPSHPQHIPPRHLPSQPQHRTHHLLYLITFLLILLVLIVFFKFTSFYPAETVAPASTLTFDSLSCQWQNSQFTVCETVSWKGDTLLFAKGYIPGGEPIEQSPPQTQTPFTYCQPVGTDEGYRLVRALAYSSSGLVQDVGQGVQCLGKPVVQQIFPPRPLPPQTIPFTTETGFRAYPKDSSSSKGQGVFIKVFPGKVDSCTYTGSWVTDNDQRFQKRSTCSGGKGIFEGYADAYQQYVVNDADLFSWAGLSQSQLNPPSQRHDRVGFWMESCDDDYYRPNHVPRYVVQGDITGFGTNTLSFNWNYYDSDTKPSVDFFFSLSCNLLPQA